MPSTNGFTTRSIRSITTCETRRTVTDRCVVFDLDGVLVMSEHLWEQGWESVPPSTATAGCLRTPGHVRARASPNGPATSANAPVWTNRPQLQGVIAVVAAAYDRARFRLSMAPSNCAGCRGESAGGVGLLAPPPHDHRPGDGRRHRSGVLPATVSSAEVAAGKPAPDVYPKPSPGWAHAAQAAMRWRTRATASGPPQPLGSQFWAWNTRNTPWIATLPAAPPASTQPRRRHRGPGEFPRRTLARDPPNAAYGRTAPMSSVAE